MTVFASLAVGGSSKANRSGAALNYDGPPALARPSLIGLQPDFFDPPLLEAKFP